MSAHSVIAIVLLSLVAFIFLRRFSMSRQLRHYNADEVVEKLKSKSAITLLDVRTVAENRNGHIKGSINIPVHELRRRMFELDDYRSREIVVYCASGNRSIDATYLLQKHGFKAVNLRGGLAAWQATQRT